MIDAALTHTPWWVYLVFAYLLWVGAKGLSTRVVPLGRLAVVPALFAVWGSVGLARVLGADAGGWLAFAASVLVGVWLGALVARAGQVRPVAGGRVWLQGSPVTLILVLVIFAGKYALGYWQGMDPGATATWAFRLADAGVTGVVIGMFAGRFLGILHRCRQAHV